MKTLARPCFVALFGLLIPALTMPRAAAQAGMSPTEKAPGRGTSGAEMPNPVTWKAYLLPADARAGEAAQIVVTAQIEAPWHLYSLTQPAGGPKRTTLEIAPTQTLETAGEGTQPAFQKEHDKGFDIDIEIYEGGVSFGLPVKLRPDLRGPQKILLHVGYQLCNDKTCLTPQVAEVPVLFSVADGPVRSDRLAALTSVPPQPPSYKSPSHEDAASSGNMSSRTGSTSRAVPSTSSGSLSAPPTVVAPDDPGLLRYKQAQQSGLLGFLAFSFGAGLLALLTPCVFPMVPITVSFFAKRKKEGTGRGIADAGAYCLGIIGTFTGLGLLMTLLFGASGISRLATNPYLNLGLAVLFIVLAANLLGAFEINLFSGLANRANAGTRRGGFLGPLLMGLTFTLTSFTCTVAFVGTLLASAATGSLLYPILGMLAFSTAFAAPFFLLALFPQYLAHLPKSGSWLVSVKAFMGLLELAAALKFLSNADLVWGRGLLTRPVFLAIWAMIGVIAGLYLLGWLRLPHDDTTRIGWIRRALGVVTVIGGIYCLAAIDGAPMGQLAAFLPPEIYPGKHSGASAPSLWMDRYDEALARAKAENRPIFVNFTGVTCTNCRWMESNMFPREDVQRELSNYVRVELYTDRGTPEDERNKALEQKWTGVVTLPVYVVLSPDGKPLKVHQDLERDAAKFVAFLREGRGILTARK